jgi:transposase
LLHRAVLHADETPVAMLDPGAGKTHRAYLWSYCTTGFEREQLVVFDFAESRAGRHPAQFLRTAKGAPWAGTLVCDDYSGYKTLFALGVTEGGCLAHARRKFHELWVNHKSTLAEQALAQFGRLYEIEREVRISPPTNACGSGRRRPSRRPTPCMPGLRHNDRRCRRAPRPPRQSTTAWADGPR